MSTDVELTNELYSTQNHSTKWPRILDQLYPICNADYAGLAVVEKPNDKGADLFHTFNSMSTNLDAETEVEYLRDYAHHEVKHFEMMLNAPVGKMIIDPDFDDYDKIIQRPDVKFSMENMNIFHRIGIRLNDEHAYNDLIAFQLRADRRSNFTEEEIAPIKPYIPHIAQAISMGRIYDAIRQRYEAVLSMLDRVKIGMVLLQANGVVVLANAYAQEIIDDSKQLQTTKTGYLKATDSLMDVYLQSRLQLLQSSTDISEKYIVRLGDDSENDDLVLELSPLLDADGDIDSGFQGIMAIVVDPNRPFLASHESVSTVFSLTKAESAVARLIANGNNYNDVAERRGVSRETIKTQARKLMRKMNVSTRAGVIRKLMTLGIPFSDGLD
ncbi:MAG: LuxR C-terminal-related transcriptional regulator [Gammaproteobacteria bacterium]|nr:LuxR C-terminal-related transcriptional regulator [Gammaproteobacteria bacterium]